LAARLLLRQSSWSFLLLKNCRWNDLLWSLMTPPILGLPCFPKDEPSTFHFEKPCCGLCQRVSACSAYSWLLSILGVWFKSHYLCKQNSREDFLPRKQLHGKSNSRYYPNQACNNLKNKLFLASKMNQSSKHYIKHQTPQRTLPKMEEMVAIPEGMRLILMWELHTISTTPINISSWSNFMITLFN